MAELHLYPKLTFSASYENKEYVRKLWDLEYRELTHNLREFPEEIGRVSIRVSDPTYSEYKFELEFFESLGTSYAWKETYSFTTSYKKKEDFSLNKMCKFILIIMNSNPTYLQINYELFQEFKKIKEVLDKFRLGYSFREKDFGKLVTSKYDYNTLTSLPYTLTYSSSGTFEIFTTLVTDKVYLELEPNMFKSDWKIRIKKAISEMIIDSYLCK